MRMVEYFPEKDIRAYLGGEADELMFGQCVHARPHPTPRAPCARLSGVTPAAARSAAH